MRAPLEGLLVTLYRVLVRLLPSSFHLEYGEESVALFRRTLRDGWRGRGWPGLGRAARVGLAGVVRAVAEEQRGRWRGAVREAMLGPGGPWLRLASAGRPWTQAVRTLRRHPALDAAVVGLLAVGIGTTVTVVSVVDGVLVRPLPYPEAHRLALVGDGAHAWPDYLDWKETVPAFDRLVAATGMTFTLEADRPVQIEGARVGEGFFELFGAEAVQGRLPTVEEFRTGRRVGVVRRDAWLRRWGGDPGLVGRTLRVDGAPVEVVGILGPDFAPPEALTGSAVDLIVPVDPSDPGLDRQNRSWGVVGRLAPSATLERAREQLHSRAEAFARLVPGYADEAGAPRRTFAPLTLLEATTGGVQTPLLVLLAGAALLLLVACANAAGLLLARATTRRGELAIRRTLGANRASILAQLVAESWLLSAVAGVVGLAAAVGGVELVRALEPGGIPRMASVSVDLRAAGAALTLAVAAGLLSGVVPALRAAATAPAPSLRTAGSGTRGRLGGTGSRGLVIGEAALASLLLSACLAVVTGFRSLATAEPGFEAHGVVALSADVGRDVPEERRAANAAAIRERLLALPGVDAVGAGLAVPYEVSGGNRCCWRGELAMDGREVDLAWVHPVTPGYFEALGARFTAGRPFGEVEAREGPHPVVLNDEAARELGNPEDLVGRTVRFATLELTVVGVVEGIRHWGSDQPVEPEFYIPYRREGTWASGLTFAVRSETPPSFEALRTAVAEAVPRAIVTAVRPMEEIMAGSLARQRFYTVVLAVFAGSALLLAAAGLGGTLLYDVRRRRHELGIRRALGASAGRLVRRTVVGGVTAAAAGAALGLLAYWPLSRYLEALVPGVDPGHPAIMTALGVLLTGVALAACWIPARAVARTDPATVMR